MIAIGMMIALQVHHPVLDFEPRADRLTFQVDRQLWNQAEGRYDASITEAGVVAKEPAFAWDMAVQMSALAAACRLAPHKYRLIYDRANRALAPYGSTYHGVFGYGVLPSGDPPDRFYDDNEWIALAQLDAFDALKNRRYLDDAIKTFDFVLSGESQDLGGGIFWREKERTSKNACSNAPAILGAARIYMANKDPRYLVIAKRLHEWTERLKDSDSLLFDNQSIDGKIDKTKWTYNTALMIRADLALYKATSERSYLSEAVAMGASAISRWVDPATGAIHDEASFAHHLAEAFLDLQPFDNSKPWRDIGLKAISEAYSSSGRDGWFGLRWDRYEVRDHRLILLYQASMERALWMAALNKT